VFQRDHDFTLFCKANRCSTYPITTQFITDETWHQEFWLSTTCHLWRTSIRRWLPSSFRCAPQHQHPAARL